MQPSSSREPSAEKPATHFAPATRARATEVQAAAARITQHPIVDHLLRNHGGLLAVLNEHRQILTVNQQMISLLGVDDAQRVLGLRPGEAIDCDHACDHEGGCGTSPFCATCGAAIAIVVCQKAGSSEFRECVLDCRVGGEPATLDLRVQASGIEVAGQTFVLLYLQDVSSDKRRAAVERAFFHDINNLLASLMGTVELLAGRAPEADADHANQARALVLRISKELKMQRALSSNQPGGYRVQLVDCEIEPLVDQVKEQLADHPATATRHIVVGPLAPTLSVRTDPFLLMRILTNMLINALEATAEGGEVTLEAAAEGGERVFTVWNAMPIPRTVALRVFQRYFSTKPGTGRGVGTYSMKLFGEEYLGGTVGFTTDDRDGTSFFLRLPAVPDADRD